MLYTSFSLQSEMKLNSVGTAVVLFNLYNKGRQKLDMPKSFCRNNIDPTILKR